MAHKASKLIVPAVVGAVNYQLACCMLVLFLEISFLRQLIWKFDMKENAFLIVSVLFMPIDLQMS